MVGPEHGFDKGDGMALMRGHCRYMGLEWFRHRFICIMLIYSMALEFCYYIPSCLEIVARPK